MGMYYGFCGSVFLAALFVNALYITVFYHRGLAHGAVRLHPHMRRFVAATGVWVTGVDPKSWCCMHRLHHKHADAAAIRTVPSLTVSLACLPRSSVPIYFISRGLRFA